MAFNPAQFGATPVTPPPTATTPGFNPKSFGATPTGTADPRDSMGATSTASGTSSPIGSFIPLAEGHQGVASVINGTDPKMQNIKQGTAANLPSSVGPAIKQTGQQYGDAANTSASELSDAMAGKESGASAGFQTVGNFAKPTVDSLNNVFSATLGPIVNGTFGQANKAVDALTGKPQGTVEAANEQDQESASNLYQAWATQHPEASKDLESLGNIGQLGMYASMARPGADTGVKEGMSNAANAVKDTAGSAISKVAELPKDAITKVQNAATSIPKSVETELVKGEPNTMAARVQEYSKAAKEAMADNSKSTPMELAGQKAEGALKSMNDQIKTLGQQKTALTTAKGAMDTGSIIKDSFNNLKSDLSDRLGVRINKDGDLVNAKGRVSSLPKGADTTLLKTTLGKFGEVMKNPTFQKVDDLIDSVQGELYKRTGVGAEPVNTQVQGILKSTLGSLNDSLKEIGGTKYSNLNSQLSDLMDTRDMLNKGLGTDANKGAALMKQLFSPNGTMSKNLFADVKRLTGTDLTSEATLAKWAMDNSGDVRQASLLKQVLGGEITSKGGFVSSLINKGVKALQNPEGKALDIIKKNIPNLQPKDLSLIDQVIKGIKGGGGLSTEDVSGTLTHDPAWTQEMITKAQGLHDYQGAALPDFNKPPQDWYKNFIKGVPNEVVSPKTAEPYPTKGEIPKTGTLNYTGETEGPNAMPNFGKVEPQDVLPQGKGTVMPKSFEGVINNKASGSPLMDYSKVPEFKNSDEAIKFGKEHTNNPRLMGNLRNLMDESYAKYESIKNDPKLEDMAYKQALKASNYREAFEAAGGKSPKAPAGETGGETGLEKNPEAGFVRNPFYQGDVNKNVSDFEVQQKLDALTKEYKNSPTFSNLEALHSLQDAYKDILSKAGK